MERKTKVEAEPGKQEVFITRDFELPLELLFKAYVEPEIIEQWMGTKVLKMEAQKHGSYHFETTDQWGGNHHFLGTIHDIVPDQKITRTFEMQGGNVGVQLELLQFEKLTEDNSRLHMHVLYESPEMRDQILKMGMPIGISMAHDRIQKTMEKHK